MCVCAHERLLPRRLGSFVPLLAVFLSFKYLTRESQKETKSCARLLPVACYCFSVLCTFFFLCKSRYSKNEHAHCFLLSIFQFMKRARRPFTQLLRQVEQDVYVGSLHWLVAFAQMEPILAEKREKKHLKKKQLLIIKNGFSKYLLLCARVFFCLFVSYLQRDTSCVCARLSA